MRRALAAILLASAALAQHRGGPLMFQRADISVSAPGTREEGGFLPQGHFECRGTTMLKLISVAYGVGQRQIAGGPDWLASTRFDIAAKAPSRKSSRPEMQEMLRALLADRFGLLAQEQQKEMPVYLLTVRPPGTRLHESAHPQAPACPSGDGDPRLNHRLCTDVGMEDLARILPEIARNYIDRPVVDATGLKGFYSFGLDWMSKPAYLAAKADGDTAISLSDALERLGLTLEPGTRPLPAIVVSRVNPAPTVDPSSATEPSARFDVAEVRRSKASPARQGLSALPSGEVTILGHTLRDLIALAFEVDSSRIAGGPKWMDSDQFDVIAKSSDALSPHTLSAMLKTLLCERFHLETQTEDRPLPVFALVTGKDAPKLKVSDGHSRSQCDLVVADQGRSYTCRNTTMAQLADRLPNVAQAYFTLPLVDLSGLKGAYDFTLTWRPRNRKSDDRGPGIGDQATAPPGGLTIFEALDRQIGVKVEQRKYPLPVVVVIKVEKL